MGVTIRKRAGGSWYVFVNHDGQRKAKCVGSRTAAEEVKRQLEARLALGDLGFMAERPKHSFETFSRAWLAHHAKLQLKPSTYRSYEQILRVHICRALGR